MLRDSIELIQNRRKKLCIQMYTFLFFEFEETQPNTFSPALHFSSVFFSWCAVVFDDGNSDSDNDIDSVNEKQNTKKKSWSHNVLFASSFIIIHETTQHAQTFNFKWKCSNLYTLRSQVRIVGCTRKRLHAFVKAFTV